MSFATILKDEFNHDRYITSILDGKIEIYICINLESSSPKILLLFDQSINDKSKCSLWESELSDERILKHMEDDVGIDSSGLDSFASYFCDAILSKPSLERDSSLFPDDPSSHQCGIRLSYNIGGMGLEGILKFSLVQEALDKKLIEMFRLTYQTEKHSQITLAIRASRPKQAKPISKVTGKDNCSSVKKDDGDEDEDDGVVKAKKRRIGGVSLFPGKKR